MIYKTEIKSLLQEKKIYAFCLLEKKNISKFLQEINLFLNFLIEICVILCSKDIIVLTLNGLLKNWSIFKKIKNRRLKLLSFFKLEDLLL